MRCHTPGRLVPLIAGAAACVVLAAAPLETRQAKAAPTLPARLATYLKKNVALDAGEQQQLLAGAPVTKVLAGDESKEVAVFGGIWINAPIDRYTEALEDIESFERGGGFAISKRISAPPTIDDFAALRLPGEDIKALRRCRIGDCPIILGEKALARFRSEVNWDGADAEARANALMRELALEYVTGYLEGGNERLSLDRDDSRPTLIADAFKVMVDQMPELTTYVPQLRRYLLEYPKVTIPEAISFLYWQETRFGARPTIRINHVTIRQGGDDTVVASKMLYASHDFWTGLDLRVLMPDASRGTGFWLVTIERSRSDGRSGASRLLARGRVRRDAQAAALARLTLTKQHVERARP